GTLEGLGNPGVQIVAGESLVDLEHADDVVFIFEGEARPVNRLTTVMPSFGIRPAPSRCKVMLETVQLLNIPLTIQGESWRLWRILHYSIVVLAVTAMCLMRVVQSGKTSSTTDYDDSVMCYAYRNTIYRDECSACLLQNDGDHEVDNVVYLPYLSAVTDAFVDHFKNEHLLTSGFRSRC
ncbi:hypothetical protein CLF_110852, partial [Clonorchis sinensis]